MALGDVDGDGDLDLVMGNYYTKTNRLFLNNGTSDPWGGVSGSDITTDVRNTRSVALGDVDGDGDLDVVVGNDEGQPNKVYLNTNTNPTHLILILSFDNDLAHSRLATGLRCARG